LRSPEWVEQHIATACVPNQLSGRDFAI
jgi:hypothetical protein